ncbi:hypothetical protein [Mycobacterium sp. 141]|uniref:hypothetical protein n=1 Tax=Mycobacterium sp. 141 TaxID=1120797 RepID=UPI00036B5474
MLIARFVDIPCTPAHSVTVVGTSTVLAPDRSQRILDASNTRFTLDRPVFGGVALVAPGLLLFVVYWIAHLLVDRLAHRVKEPLGQTQDIRRHSAR